jgi:phosphatidylserine/phosphatidylglycerophosphate/cardiolipin synthase-like enzyme
LNKLDYLIPKIKRNIAQFKKPGVLFVRPGYCTTKTGWLSKEEAIVAITAVGKEPPKLPSQIDGTPVDVRQATQVEQFSHDQPEQFSRLADHRAEFRGTSLLPEFDPSTGSVVAPIAPKIAAAHQTKIPLHYKPANVPLSPANGTIPMICHVSPDAGWAQLQKFISGTKNHLKVSMYDFTSEHILKLFETQLAGKPVQLTLDAPPRNPSANQTDPQTVKALQSKLGKTFSEAWALVRSSPEADSWIFPTAYHIKVMVRDSQTVWLSSGNLNNSNQPEIDPIGNPTSDDQKTAKHSDRDWHVIIQSAALAKTFEAYLDSDFQIATLNAANLSPALKPPPNPTTPPTTIGNFTFAAPQSITEPVTITPLLTPDPGVYPTAMLNLINSVKQSLYIQLQYIHPSSDPANAVFTNLLDAVGAKINAGLDVKIILSEFQTTKGGLDALQAAGISLNNVKIQNSVHNKGFVFDHRVVVVSSMNWSGEGVLSNRDAGVIIDNATAAQYYERVFLDDWTNHAAQKSV